MHFGQLVLLTMAIAYAIGLLYWAAMDPLIRHAARIERKRSWELALILLGGWYVIFGLVAWAFGYFVAAFIESLGYGVSFPYWLFY